MTSATKTVHCSLRSRPHCVWRQSAASRRGFHLFPVSAASEAKQTHGRRCGNSFIIRDGNFPTINSLVKTGFWLRFAPKRFSLWSLRGFFLTRQKEISQKDNAGAFAPAPTLAAPKARRYAPTRSVALAAPLARRYDTGRSPARYASSRRLGIQTQFGAYAPNRG